MYRPQSDRTPHAHVCLHTCAWRPRTAQLLVAAVKPSSTWGCAPSWQARRIGSRLELLDQPLRMPQYSGTALQCHFVMYRMCCLIADLRMVFLSQRSAACKNLASSSSCFCFHGSDHIQLKDAFVCMIRIVFSLPLVLIRMKKPMVVTAEAIQVCWGKAKAEFQIGSI